jgi:mannose-1-phosphate guanylyltransferase
MVLIAASKLESLVLRTTSALSINVERSDVLSNPGARNSNRAVLASNTAVSTNVCTSLEVALITYDPIIVQ